MTISELSEKLNYDEFLEWVEFFEYEMRAHDKMDYYLAQIAQCSLLPYSKKEPEIKNFLIKFKTEKEDALKVDGMMLKEIFKSALGVQ